MSDWTETYRPTTLSEVRGNDKARDQLKEWAETWDDHRDAVIVHGSPGVGKTSAAHALANDMGWPVMELNASDDRKADVVERVAGEAAKSGTLTGGEAGRRLVILDEADNFHGSADYGGSREVTRVVKDASQPIVLVANEFYDMSQTLRNACETIEFRDISKRSIVPSCGISVVAKGSSTRRKRSNGSPSRRAAIFDPRSTTCRQSQRRPRC